MSSFLAYYSSLKGQQGTVPNDPASVLWLNNLFMLDGDPSVPLGIAPPYSGSGILRIYTVGSVVLQNTGVAVVRVRMGLGVDKPIAGAKPMYPYLGVYHGPQDAITEYETLQPGEARKFTDRRIDIVDNALESDQPIPGWPTWKVEGSPIICICANCDTAGAKVIYRDAMIESWAF